ncbi:hypothetical protein AB0A67_23315, partial [Streptomyces eurythermus]
RAVTGFFPDFGMRKRLKKQHRQITRLGVFAYDAVSASARAALGLPEVRVEAGFPAELLAVRGDRLAGALSLAYSRIVVHRGRVVARTSAVREYCHATGAGEPGLPRQGRGELS